VTFVREFPLRRALPALLLLLPLALAGCGGSPTLATVGSRTITVTDFEDAGRGAAQQYPGSPDSAKQALLDDLVRRALLLEEANRLKVVPDSTYERIRKQAADRLAVEALMQKLVPQDAQVSDAEAKELYEQRNTEGHLFLIFASDQGQGQQAAKDLAAGQPFADVAKRINNPAMLPANGDLQWVQPGAMVSPLDEWVVKAPLNKLMGPVAAPGFGWFVGRVTERRPNKQQPFELMKPGLVQMLKARKLRTLQQKAYTDLRDQYQVKLDTGGPQALYTRLQQSNTSMMQNMGGHPMSPEPTAADTGVSIAHYLGADGKPVSYTLAAALRDIADPMGQRVDPSNLTMLRQWIESMVVQRALRIEATRRHMAEEPDVARRSREQVNNMVLQQMYGQAIASRMVQPTPADVQEAFKRHSSRLIRLDEAKVVVATAHDSGTALGLARGLTGPGSLRKVATATPGVSVADKELTFPSKDQVWQMQQANLMTSNPGDPRGPFKMGRSWVVYELVSKVQGPQAFDQLESQIVRALEAEAAEFARDRVLQQYTDSLRHVFKVQVSADKLKRVPWPIPPKAA
jgi:hypothetical protein